jgi:hypothetical protein
MYVVCAFFVSHISTQKGVNQHHTLVDRGGTFTFLSEASSRGPIFLAQQVIC